MTENKAKLAKDCIKFERGETSLISETDTMSQGIEKIRQKITDLSNIKNLHFLLGSGTSAESIPTMKTLLEIVKANVKGKEASLFQKITSSNLEEILGILYSRKVALKGTGENTRITENLIDEIEQTIFSEINIDFKESAPAKVNLELYKKFYQKITWRNKDLARVNIFTTNNDLFTENTLDSLNINYNNGFGGGLDRSFNPARFNYTFSRKIDSGIEKFEPLNNMIYLYKLHGSISWIECEDANLFFNIKEVQVSDMKPKKNVLIYPTPMKQNMSLGAPYADLIREFQKKLLLPHSLLIIMGYSFSDEHINNIIYQALASNSSITIVVFGNYEDTPIFKVNDQRVYKISGKDNANHKIHYFEYIVNNFLPDMYEPKDLDLLKEFTKQLEEYGKKNTSPSNPE